MGRNVVGPKCTWNDVVWGRRVIGAWSSGWNDFWDKNVIGQFVLLPFFRSSSTSLLAVSAKQFSTRHGHTTCNLIPFHCSNLMYGADGRRVPNGGHIQSDEVCFNLCRLHPRCHAAFYGHNRVIASHDEQHFTDCGFTTSGSNDILRVHSLYTAFVS